MIPAVLAADLAKSRISIAVIDRSGRDLLQRSEPCPEYTDQSAFAERFLDLAGTLVKSVQKKCKLFSAGISVCGSPAEPERPISAREVGLSSALHKKLKLPVAVEQHRNATVLGEAWKGVAARKKDVVALIAGAGIEAGILSAGRLLVGSHDLAGSAAWMAVSEADGFEVRQGKHGVTGIERMGNSPLFPNCRATTAHWAVIFDIIMDEGEIVDQLDCDRSRQSEVPIATGSRANQQN